MKKLLKMSWMAFVFCLICAGVFTVNVNAEEAKSEPVTTLYYSAKSNKLSKTSYFIIGKGEVKPTNIKSSNPKVITAKAKKVDGHWVVYMTMKKTGTAKISYSSGGDGVSTHTYVVKKYTSPLKKLKIGKKNFTSSYKNSRHNSGGKLTGKVSLKLKSGWKCTRCYQFKTADLGQMTSAELQKEINLKKSITVKKGYRLIFVFEKGTKSMTLAYDAK